MPTLDGLLRRLWEDYIAFNPHALKVHRLLEQRGEIIVNDHIAFRTYDLPPIRLDALAAPFIGFGYEPRGRYEFPEKKLRARHYEHPDADRPRVFISELRTAEFDEELRGIVRRLVEQVPPDAPHRWDLPVSGRLWDIAYADYERLRRHSEYAAWLAAFGFRANHFTVSVNALTTFDSLGQLNDFLKQHGFALNTAGGEIKGSPEDRLEQSATLAGEVEVAFTDGAHAIPACYYEFARRYPMPDGRLFSGFVARSADKIFQSTDRR